MTERTQTPSPYSAILGLLVIVVIIMGGLLLLNRIEAENPTEAELTPTPTPAARVSFVLDGLPQIENAEYVVWSESTEGTTFLGGFIVNSAGKIEGVGNTAFSDNELIVDSNLSSATRIFITLELSGEHIQPTGPEVLSAEMKEGIGALLSPLAGLSEKMVGEYLLATPTDGPNTSETSGIWFIRRNPDGSDSAGLTLPQLPRGWEYSGVVRHQDTLLYTGSFANAAERDSFSFDGLARGPEFPGEDFLVNQPATVGFNFPVNLTDGTTEVTVRVTTAEPLANQTSSNELPIPVLQYVVLRAMIIEGANTNTNYPMASVDLSLPAGIVVIR